MVHCQGPNKEKNRAFAIEQTAPDLGKGMVIISLYLKYQG